MWIIFADLLCGIGIYIWHFFAQNNPYYNHILLCQLIMVQIVESVFIFIRKKDLENISNLQYFLCGFGEYIVVVLILILNIYTQKFVLPMCISAVIWAAYIVYFVLCKVNKEKAELKAVAEKKALAKKQAAAKAKREEKERIAAETAAAEAAEKARIEAEEKAKKDAEEKAAAEKAAEAAEEERQAKIMAVYEPLCDEQSALEEKIAAITGTDPKSLMEKAKLSKQLKELTAKLDELESQL